MNFKKQKAFTLAEVLITLAIIGVVASMVLPTILQKQEEISSVSGLKKAYSALNDAFKLAVLENGTPDTWNLGYPGGVDNPTGRKNILKTITPYLKVTKDCGNGMGCLPDVIYRFIDGSLYSNPPQEAYFNRASYLEKVMLADGTALSGRLHNSQCKEVHGTTPALQNICGTYNVDINGFKGPNTIGKDFFNFWVTKYGIVPIGTQAETPYFDCDGSKGEGCAGWVIFNGNLDYLHCSDLSWTGKKSCN